MRGCTLSETVFGWMLHVKWYRWWWISSTTYRPGIWTTACWVVYNGSVSMQIFLKRCRGGRFGTCGHGLSVVDDCVHSSWSSSISTSYIKMLFPCQLMYHYVNYFHSVVPCLITTKLYPRGTKNLSQFLKFYQQSYVWFTVFPSRVTVITKYNASVLIFLF